MRALFAVLAVASLLGLSCEGAAGPTTVSVQYVNNAGVQVLFEIVDATNTKVASYSMGERNSTNAADPVTTVTGVLPMTVEIPIVNRDASCSIPSFVGVNSTQSQLLALVNGKIVRIEATAFQTLQCVEENP